MMTIACAPIDPDLMPNRSNKQNYRRFNTSLNRRLKHCSRMSCRSMCRALIRPHRLLLHFQPTTMRSARAFLRCADWTTSFLPSSRVADLRDVDCSVIRLALAPDHISHIVKSQARFLQPWDGSNSHLRLAWRPTWIFCAMAADRGRFSGSTLTCHSFPAEGNRQRSRMFAQRLELLVTEHGAGLNVEHLFRAPATSVSKAGSHDFVAGMLLESIFEEDGCSHAFSYWNRLPGRR
jgi:hypothetical protein